MGTFEMDTPEAPRYTDNPLASPGVSEDGTTQVRQKANTTKDAPANWGMRDPRANNMRAAVPGNLVIPESIIEGIFQDKLFDDLADSHERDRTGRELWSILRVKLKMVVAADIYKAIYMAGHDGTLKPIDGINEGELNDMSTIYSEPEQNDWLDHMRSTEVECRNKPWFFHPNSPLRMWWDIGQVVMLGYVAMLVPIRAGFSIRVQVWSFEFYLDLITDVYFLTDIFMNFRTAYYDRRTGNLIIEDYLIAKRYFKTWFSLDFVSCIPFSYYEMYTNRNIPSINSVAGSSAEAKLFKVLRLLRLAKMLRLSRLKGIIERQDEAVGPMLQSFKLVGILCGICFVAHLFACMWHFVGEDDQYSNGYFSRAETVLFEGVLDSSGELIERGWVYYLDETHSHNLYAQMNNGSTYGAAEDFERSEAGHGTSTHHRYTAALYWAMTTLSTVGYGDFHARTDREMLFSIVVELCGGISFAMLVGSLSAVLTSRSASETIFNEKMDSVREFLRVKEVPVACKRKVLSYYSHYYQEKSVFDEAEIIERLPEYLQTNLIHIIYGSLIEGVPMFKGLDEHVIARLCFALRPLRVIGGDTIMEKGKKGNEMFVLIQGEVEVKSGAHSLGYLNPGSYFGELAVLNDDGLSGSDVIRTRTVQAVSDCDLVFLTKRDMHAVQLDYPELDQQMRRFMEMRREHIDDFREHRMTLVFDQQKTAGKRSSEDQPPPRHSTRAAMTMDVVTQKVAQLESEQYGVQKQLEQMQDQNNRTLEMLSGVAYSLRLLNGEAVGPDAA